MQERVLEFYARARAYAEMEKDVTNMRNMGRDL